MTIQKTLTNGNLDVALEGRLDTTTAPQLDAELGNLEGVNSLVIDMSALEYISSSGLRVLLRASKIMKKQGTMEIHNVSDIVREIFDVTGFTDILTII